MLQRLVEETDETALLTVVSHDGNGASCLERVETSQSLRLSVSPGRRLPLHAGASQKALLAFMSERAIDATLDSKLERLCQATITDPNVMRDELARIRRRGWAGSFEETNVGVWGVAVPVLDDDGDVTCAVGVAGPSARLSATNVRTDIERVHAAATRDRGAARLARPAAAGHPGTHRQQEARQTMSGSERPLRGKVAIVTGAAKGIGGVVTEHLARDGAHVSLVGRTATALEEHARGVDERYPDRESLVAVCDVTNEPAVESMVAAVTERFGGIDILVNTAGGTGPIETPAHAYPADELRAILELNVVGTFLPCKHVIPHMISRGGGRIVNIAGTSGLRGYRNRSGYSASKWAVRGLTRTLALELGPHDITVNDVCPERHARSAHGQDRRHQGCHARHHARAGLRRLRRPDRPGAVRRRGGHRLLDRLPGLRGRAQHHRPRHRGRRRLGRVTGQTARPSASPGRIWTALGAVYVIWSTTFLAIAVNETMPPLLATGMRFFVAGACCMPIALRPATASATAPRRQWQGASVVGVLLMFAGNGGIVWAERTIPAGVAGLVIATVPLWMTAIDRVLFHQRARRRRRRARVGSSARRCRSRALALEGAIDLSGAGRARRGRVVGGGVDLPAPRPAPPTSVRGGRHGDGGRGRRVLVAGTRSARALGPAARRLLAAPRCSLSPTSSSIGSWIGFTAYLWLLRDART